MKDDDPTGIPRTLRPPRLTSLLVYFLIALLRRVTTGLGRNGRGSMPLVERHILFFDLLSVNPYFGPSSSHSLKKSSANSTGGSQVKSSTRPFGLKGWKHE